MKSHQLLFFIIIGMIVLTLTTNAQSTELGGNVPSGVDRLSKSLEIHGFISQGWMRSDNNNWLAQTEDGSFDFREVGLSFMGEVHRDIRVGVQLVSRQLGFIEEGGVEVDWAYIDYYANQMFGARVGRTKTPIGIYGENRDFDVLRTFILMPQGVYNDTLRDQAVAVNGISLYGNTSFEDIGNLNYTAWIGGMPFDPDGGLIQWVGEYADNYYDIDDGNVDYTAGFNLRWETPFEGLLVSGSYLRLYGIEFKGATSATLNAVMGIPVGVPVLIEVDDLDVVTYGFEYVKGPLTWATEYITYRGEASTTITGVSSLPKSIYWEGYYNSLTWQVSDSWSVGAYYSLFYEDAADKDGSDLEALGRGRWEAWQKDLALAVRYDITDSLSLKAEVHRINGTAMLFDGENDRPIDEDWRLYALKLSYVF